MTHPASALIRGAAAATLLCLAAFSAPAHAGDPIPSKPEPGALKLGIEPWLGYGQWYIAQKKGIFDKQGLSKVDIELLRQAPPPVDFRPLTGPVLPRKP